MNRSMGARWHVDIVGCIFWIFGMLAFCLALQGMAAACLTLGIAILLCNIETRQ